MAVRAKLFIDDVELNILLFSFLFKQGSDVTGRPSQKTVFKGIKIVLETQKDANFYEWMMAKDMSKNFEIHIIPNTLGGRIRKIKFYDAHLIHWNNNFSATDEDPVSETLTISAAGVEDSTSAGVYEASWRVSFDDNGNEEVTTIAEYEPELLGYYFKDRTDEIIAQKDIRTNQKVNLVIETKNAEGRTIKINLNDSKLDFIYNNKVLENDILTGIAIEGDETIIPLTAIKQ